MLTVERSPAKVAGRGAGAGGVAGGAPRVLEVGAARAADGFEAGRDVEARVDVLGFEQPLVRRFEILARDVEVDEHEALARGLIREAVREGDLAQLLAQDDGARPVRDGLQQALDGALRRLVLDEKVCVEQRRLDALLKTLRLLALFHLVNVRRLQLPARRVYHSDHPARPRHDFV